MLALLGMVAMCGAAASTPTTCTGYGARLESRVETAVVNSTSSRLAYHAFANTLRSFRGVGLIRQGLRVAGAFEAEAERWVERAWSSSIIGEVIFGNSSDDANQTMNQTTFQLGNSSDNSSWGVGSAVPSALSCLSRLYHSVMAKFDARPPSFITEPPASRSNGLVLLSGGDRNAALSERVVKNHAAFARRHGYAHWWHRGNLAASKGWLPYWHKVAMLRLAFRRFPEARAFAWVDDDVVLTNHLEGEDMLERALAKRPNASVIVTRDPGSSAGLAALNTGVILVRRNADGLAVLNEMWRRADADRDDGLVLAMDPQSAGCLHEQQALQEMLAHRYWRARVAVLEQREDGTDARARSSQPGQPPAAAEGWNLNTFLRWSHFHGERQEELRYDTDVAASGWRWHDFAGHCSGLSPARRALCVAALLGAVIS